MWRRYYLLSSIERLLISLDLGATLEDTEDLSSVDSGKKNTITLRCPEVVERILVSSREREVLHSTNTIATILALSPRSSRVNADECMLIRMQEMSLDYHFTVEQEVGSTTHAFFGFSGD
ncbi:cellulose synthase-like protein [Striga asiatica]|uniref:Cellulose synthase-like protein n=1 Tax=Striga asiatica TaxID=4170 RepID=A0A5A7Q565_STRAF|nr:cellulose synthase-like protein [Striga asiatica]